MLKSQKFEIGYHVITWDLEGRIEEAFPFLIEMGFTWFESLLGDTISGDFASRNMTLGHQGLPQTTTDYQMFHRLGLFSWMQEEHGLRVSSLYNTIEITNPIKWPLERHSLMSVARYLKGCGSKILVCGGGPAETEKNPRSEEEWQIFTRHLEEIGAYTNKLGIRTVYHPHLDCFIETHEQLDKFMSMVDTDKVGLCIDPVHPLIKGSDPVEMVRQYVDHIHYLHYKDCEGDIYNLHGKDRYSSFCELGAGHVNLAAMTEILLENDFDGLVIIELDESKKAQKLVPARVLSM